MIGVRLMGGLGNQLFQYGAARRLALARATKIVLNTRVVAGRSGRAFALGDYHLPVRIDRSGWLTRDTALHRLGLLPRMALVEEDRWREGRPRRLFADLPDGVLLHGYWQDRQYLDPIGELLRREISLDLHLGSTADKLSRRLEDDEVIAVHVRRGDYAQDPVVRARHGILSQEYYRTALEIVNEHRPNASVWIFSDDAKWCHAQLRLSSRQRVVSDGRLTAMEELELMRRCHHHIVANSTFSWWGAWLATSPDQVVVLPNQWFANEEIDAEALACPGWTTI